MINDYAPFWSIFLDALPILIGITTLLWLLSLYLKNSSIIDPLWGTLFVVANVYYYLQTPEADPGRSLLVLILVAIWGLRLSLFLIWRNWGKEEDYRYQRFREEDGSKYWWTSLIRVFWLQGGLAWLISAPLLGAQLGTNPLGWLDYLAVAIWIIGIIFEAGGDWQLARFKAQRKDKDELLTTGLWKYTRHPNYFGDTACWWAYALFSMAATWYIPVLGAMLMTYLIVKISGVAMMERDLSDKKPKYQAYVKRTSAFFPMPPKSR